MLAFLAAAALTVAAATPAATPCEPAAVTLGGAGRVRRFAFLSPLDDTPVCALVANLALDGVRARVVTPPASADALVTLRLPDASPLVASDVSWTTLAARGPYVIAPGGAFAANASDATALPRVVIAYAGPRALVIATTPVTLVDLAKMLKDQPGTFDADAIERAVLVASGDDARMTAGATTLALPAPATAERALLVFTPNG